MTVPDRAEYSFEIGFEMNELVSWCIGASWVFLVELLRFVVLGSLSFGVVGDVLSRFLSCIGSLKLLDVALWKD